MMTIMVSVSRRCARGGDTQIQCRPEPGTASGSAAAPICNMRCAGLPLAEAHTAKLNKRNDSFYDPKT